MTSDMIWRSKGPKVKRSKIDALPLRPSELCPWQESIDFVYSPQGAGLFFPEAYESFVKALPADERSNLIGSYAKRLDSPDLEVENGKFWKN